MSTTPELAVANSARANAARMRAEKLISVASSEATIHDLIMEASGSRGRPLLRVTLRQLLLAVPGWGNERASRIISKMTAVLGAKGSPTPQRKLTIAWLLDPRAGGRRFMAFCDSLKENDTSPWSGFPFAPQPSRGETHGAA